MTEERIYEIRQPKPVWRIEFFPNWTLECEKKPKLWTRFGIWLWFGLRGEDID